MEHPVRSHIHPALIAVVATVIAAACSSNGGSPADPVGADSKEIDCNVDFGDPLASMYDLPFRAGRSYTLIQGHCPSNPAWGHHNWFAWDFDFAIGDTVLATRGGTVLFVRESFADGTRVCGNENYVFIEHADHTVMHYMHLTTGGALVDVGDLVQQGDPIGLSGDSGCSSGPHLHIALFRDRTNFDRQSTLPVNFANTAGPLDSKHAPVQGGLFTAQ